jgi:hypothetical protein
LVILIILGEEYILNYKEILVSDMWYLSIKKYGTFGGWVLNAVTSQKCNIHFSPFQSMVLHSVFSSYWICISSYYLCFDTSYL